MLISDEDRARVAATVKAAEATTDAEIVAITATQSDAYHDVGLHWAVLGMFLVLALQAIVPGHFVPVLDWALGGGWSHDWPLWFLLTAQLVLLAVVFLLLRLAFSPLGVRMALTPPATKARRVRRRAVLLFRTSIEARTQTQTGVLLYVSTAEHRAEIVTDAAIHAAIGPEAWGDAMATLIAAIKDGRPGDGIVEAIGAIGAVLAQHFPYTGTDPNELPDRLIEL
ncbi:MAG: TPM domain-containing protein [Sphingomonas sp.]